MIERRRAERFVLQDPGVGSLRLVHDVRIAQIDARGVVVVAPSPLPRGERLLLEIPLHRDTAPSTRLVRAVQSRVAVEDGSLGRRVRLELLDGGGQTEGLAAEAAEFARLRAHRETMMGALIRRVPVRVVEASTAGCVMECPSVIRDGSVGFVQVRTSTQGHSEAVRINRTSQIANRTWQYRMAAEFLTLGPRSPQSLRGIATIMTR